MGCKRMVVIDLNHNISDAADVVESGQKLQDHPEDR